MLIEINSQNSGINDPQVSRPVYSMEKNPGVLLMYCDYPESVRRSIHSTNLIERMNREIRRRIKTIYLRSAEINEKWSLRSLKGFYTCQDEIREMFQERYP